ncbi:MAG: regulatory iron-sulfur-containing complex subunit RicT [Planctomycetota bacterium]|nr:regulatory iron-sulfur-containing complex subunit RicT [Planctomycetota bacterium]MDI6787859.1 regulatory iron-sulfur-containing complex subunit RicT [Planctomycetota bacterium]
MYLVTVRYGLSRTAANFKYPYNDIKTCDKCLVKTDSGTEAGVITSTLQEIKPNEDVSNLGTLLRKMTLEDFKEVDKTNKEKIPQLMEYAKKQIETLGLDMKISLIDYLFGGEKIIFYFASKGKVDFRELVKVLGQEYKTRIEMKQIGARDEARLLADIGHCGYELCCRTFIKEMGTVTMKMAKNQKASLDPLKISGLCGRLMCCLRYEDAIYTELRKNLPRKGTIIKTTQGTGEVVDLEVLAQKAIVELEEGETRIKIGPSEVLSIIREPTLKVEQDEGKQDDKQ